MKTSTIALVVILAMVPGGAGVEVPKDLADEVRQILREEAPGDYVLSDDAWQQIVTRVTDALHEIFGECRPEEGPGCLGDTLCFGYEFSGNKVHIPSFYPASAAGPGVSFKINGVGKPTSMSTHEADKFLFTSILGESVSGPSGSRLNGFYYLQAGEHGVSCPEEWQ